MRIYTKLVLLTSLLLLVSLSAFFFLANQTLEQALSGEGDSLLMIFLPILIVSVLAAFLIGNIILKPIRDLNNAANQIATGQLDAEIEIDNYNELGILAGQLKKTSQALITRIGEQEKLNKKLEDQKNEILLQKEVIEKSNLQVRDSISYAKRIQSSLLPDLDGLNRLVSGVMAYYRPKDIVSGDFYWSERVRTGRNDYLIVAAADCTGHGVPGAIMSIMGSNLLTNIVYYQNYLDPRKILARLDKAIKFELYRGDDNSTKKDGMEIGICVINLDDLSAEFAGIGMPLYMVREGRLEVYKSIKQMAGGMEGEEREVENMIGKESFKFNVGDRLYLATDGFQDQFGGEEDKKFMAKNFRTLLTELSDTPMKNQEEIFKQKFENWKKSSDQTDDVMILGIEI